MKRSSGILICTIAVVGSLFMTGCSSTKTEKRSLNQLPVNIQMAAAEHVGDGRIDEIKVKTRKGARWYEFEYEKNDQEMELSLDDTGRVMEKKKD